ncbi:MAG TPA: DUF1501 domain-containing protein [Stellaceae bacterium]|jgi:uncharacterized protein (DUF1501 family)|nr:DUF1501 domain-containing protein [Stellaceae bacterium]
MARRRDLLKLTAGGAAAFAVLGMPGVVFAALPGERRFVVVLLRGALDGLAAVPPLADAQYRDKRGSLALPAPGEPNGCLALDETFALHPALAPIYPYWQKRELLFVHASGNGYRTRSHFDGQDLMESGLSAKTGISDGWLNRALALMPRGRRLGLAVGGAVPLILRGKVEVASWEPPGGLHDASPDFIAALAPLYRRDALLGPALAEGLKAQSFSEGVLGDSMQGGRGFGPKNFAPLVEAAGKLLAAPDGPRLAALDMGGWDTHVNQGAAQGRLAQNFAGYADGLDALAKGMGEAWRQTVVVAVTEFGRTVAVNGNGGTDHGTASVLLVMGGAVKGGRIAGDWPGLAQLQDDRDLRVATDSRRVMKGILRDHLGLDAAALDRKVFPETQDLRPFAGLVRA